MARKLYYRILDDGRTRISDDEWSEITRLQHWYNSEFYWTAGKLALKMYVVFLNTEEHDMTEHQLEQTVHDRRSEYVHLGYSENEIIDLLEKENLIIVKKGGYFDNCLASGFTRVAGNEFNAFLVSEFLLKISFITPGILISLHDEGEFIKTKKINIRHGEVHIPVPDRSKLLYYRNMVEHHHVFSIVDASKYDRFPSYHSTIPNFNSMTQEERLNILKEWNWLGFENNYDINGDDIQGFNLNEKVKTFVLESM